MRIQYGKTFAGLEPEERKAGRILIEGTKANKAIKHSVKRVLLVAST